MSLLDGPGVTSMPSAADVIGRRRMRVHGIVQGVGFRPFVYSLAVDLRLGGHVGNDASGVFIEVEGAAATMDRFVDRLLSELPPLAHVDDLEVDDVEPTGGKADFTIVESTDADGARTLVPPDVAMCDECLAELDDPADRRYRYPFVNCTNCGPRFTIIRDLPYDRPATTMADFELCDDCAAEYADPLDRRYHAQPVACPDCGPRIRLDDDDRTVVGTDEVLAGVHERLADGAIVAVKGLGGYHLACDATDAEAVDLLRIRKGRSDKPFAVMAPDLDAVSVIADATDDEIAALTDPSRPIVLLRRRHEMSSAALAPGVAPGNPLIGVMLPYTPLHHLLFRPVPGSDVPPPSYLVLTSGNRSDEPICFRDDDARERLADLVDAFLAHDRPIEVPCDDSVVRVIDGEVQPIRRSRGVAPVPVRLGFEAPPVLGVGGELKNTCCVASGRHAWVGQHVGDMENLPTLDAFEASVDAFTTMYRVDPVALGVDLHPNYLTRRWALERAREMPGAPIVDVQHHHAHVASVMAEHGLRLDAEVLGVAFDGTGYGHGADGSPQIWGGEVLASRFDRYERVAHLAPLPLPGGDEAVRNPCRIAVAWLTELGIPLTDDIPAVASCDDTERSVVPRQVVRDVGCVPTTSMGRLFDVVSSLLGVRHRVGYEAQAAIELEHLAAAGVVGRAPLSFDLREPTESGSPIVIDPTPLLRDLVDGVRSGVEPADLAIAFHVAVADLVAELADRLAAGRPVALSGGVFQNALLTRLVRRRLTGHDVLTHRLVPPNDGGLSLGQAAVTAACLVRQNQDHHQERNHERNQERSIRCASESPAS
ncbi:MAG: carbamoyltransferase HypF [Actinomycetota bacterium]